ncbi:unnamed protein product [Cuscuta epithymum]|uniref:Uncharacterized protein n=1 Tax=Cuscuta epithymum TaxID=186058 RepID=A0AAV0EDH5_9ASTE|nr:unnamed protein product [Cuscuta epithymum]
MLTKWIGVHKQWSLECGVSIDKHEYWNPMGCGTWEESWLPVGIWNLGGHFHLLAFPYINTYRREGYCTSPSPHDYPDGENYIPYLISGDLETKDMKMVYLTQEKKFVKLVSNLMGYTPIYKESNIDITQEWKDYKIFARHYTYARIYNQSLQLI